MVVITKVSRKNGSAGQNLSGRARAIFTRAVNLRGFPPGVPTGVGKNSRSSTGAERANQVGHEVEDGVLRTRQSLKCEDLVVYNCKVFRSSVKCSVVGIRERDCITRFRTDYCTP